MLPKPYQQLHRNLQRFIPAARLITDPLRTLVYGTDASLYRLIPKLVVRVESEEEMRRILALAHQYETPVTFRAAGTSLSGKAVTDSVLLQLGDGWRGWRIGAGAAPAPTPRWPNASAPSSGSRTPAVTASTPWWTTKTRLKSSST